MAKKAMSEKSILRSRRFAITALGVTVALGMAVAPAAAQIKVGLISSIPESGNAVVTATVEGDGAADLSVYFRRAGHGDFYYVSMSASEDGSYWAVLPEPGLDTSEVELFVGQHDLDSGSLVGRTDIMTAPVLGVAEPLSGPQADAAAAMTVGNTTQTQAGNDVAWFNNEGISGRSGGGEGSGNRSRSDGTGWQDIVPNLIVVGDPGGDPKEVTIPRP